MGSYFFQESPNAWPSAGLNLPSNPIDNEGRTNHSVLNASPLDGQTASETSPSNHQPNEGRSDFVIYSN